MLPASLPVAELQQTPSPGQGRFTKLVQYGITRWFILVQKNEKVLKSVHTQGFQSLWTVWVVKNVHGLQTIFTPKETSYLHFQELYEIPWVILGDPELCCHHAFI